MVTAVVRKNPIPELGPSGGSKGILPDLGLMSMNGAPAFTEIEESKVSPRLAAPKSLAPLASRSKATLEPMSLVMGNNNFESKLSRAVNDGSQDDTEFESSKTLMPKDNQVDEITALLGHERSMADL